MTFPECNPFLLNSSRIWCIVHVSSHHQLRTWTRPLHEGTTAPARALAWLMTKQANLEWNTHQVQHGPELTQARLCPQGQAFGWGTRGHASLVLGLWPLGVFALSMCNGSVPDNSYQRNKLTSLTSMEVVQQLLPRALWFGTWACSFRLLSRVLCGGRFSTLASTCSGSSSSAIPNGRYEFVYYL